MDFVEPCCHDQFLERLRDDVMSQMLSFDADRSAVLSSIASAPVRAAPSIATQPAILGECR